MKGFRPDRHGLNPSSAVYRQPDPCSLCRPQFSSSVKGTITPMLHRSLKVKDMAVKCLACGTSIIIKGRRAKAPGQVGRGGEVEERVPLPTFRRSWEASQAGRLQGQGDQGGREREEDGAASS